MIKSADLGKDGEHIARKHLEGKGYEILCTNFRWGKNEVDIIARQNKEIVFVEVKTRFSNFFGEPEQAVNKEKQRAIIRVADGYITKNNIHQEARFDIISIIKNGDKTEINHIIKAFEPTPF